MGLISLSLSTYHVFISQLHYFLYQNLEVSKFEMQDYARQISCNCLSLAYAHNCTLQYLPLSKTSSSTWRIQYTSSFLHFQRLYFLSEDELKDLDYFIPFSFQILNCIFHVLAHIVSTINNVVILDLGNQDTRLKIVLKKEL